MISFAEEEDLTTFTRVSYNLILKGLSGKFFAEQELIISLHITKLISTISTSSSKSHPNEVIC
jgi:hypothetical protein